MFQRAREDLIRRAPAHPVATTPACIHKWPVNNGVKLAPS
jgi:hypothetical protein